MTIQEEIEEFADDTDKPVLRWLFDQYHWESQWNFVAHYQWIRYGSLSYEVKRIWSPTTEGYVLYDVLGRP